jgi:hypothetical protein
MPALSSTPHLVRSRWAAIGAAVAVTLGAGGLVGVSASPDTATALTPITPVRILDTRSGDRVGSLDIADASTPVRLRIAGAPNSGIPASGVTGVSLNVTVVDTRANDFGGYLTAYPCASTSSPRPDVSTLNFTSGQTLANAVTVPTSTDGHICIYVYGTAHVLVDANGYYSELDPPTSIDAYTTDETDTLLATKADQTDLDALAGNMVAKADLDALETLSGTVSSKADQTDLDALTTTVTGKADRRSLRPARPALPVPLAALTLVGDDVDVAIGDDGNPIVAYEDGNGSLLTTACTSIDCSGANTTSIIDDVSSSGNPAFVTITIGDNGLPLIAYTDTGTFRLHVAACSTADCTGPVTVTRLEQASDAGKYASLAIGVDGKPIIAYYVAASNSVRVLTCETADCAGPVTTVDLVSGQNSGFIDLAIGADGNPVIVFDSLNDGLKAIACSDTDCSGTPSVTQVDSSANILRHQVVIGVNGLPIVTYLDSGLVAFRSIACTEPDCSTFTGPTTLVTGKSHEPRSIVVADTGNPIVATYEMSSARASLIRCHDATCTSADDIEVASDGYAPDVAVTIGVDGTPALAYLDTGARQVTFAPLWWATGGR